MTDSVSSLRCLSESTGALTAIILTGDGSGMEAVPDGSEEAAAAAWRVASADDNGAGAAAVLVTLAAVGVLLFCTPSSSMCEQQPHGEKRPAG